MLFKLRTVIVLFLQQGQVLSVKDVSIGRKLVVTHGLERVL